MKFEDLKGQTLTAVDGAEKGSERITFTTQSGERYAMFHYDDCCESVLVEDVNGDVADLLNTPVLTASETTNSERHPDGVTPEFEPDSFTWTFYRIGTIKGTVVLRWFGESNGYYSEDVSFAKV